MKVAGIATIRDIYSGSDVDLGLDNLAQHTKMHISAPFIRRPVATSLLSIAILLAGGVGFYFLPVAALPRVDFPTVSVRASLLGASPETMASSVATPLERQFGRIAGVTQMTSTSQLGAVRVTLQFVQVQFGLRMLF